MHCRLSANRPSADSPGSGDPVSDLLSAPSRRNVKALTEALVNVREGGPAVAIFRTKRYGLYRVAGTATKSEVYGSLLLAGEPLGIAGSPSPRVVGIEGGEGEWIPEVAGDVQPVDVAHGEVVSALFEAEPYGQFVITGHAVALGDRSMMLGGWLLNAGGEPGRAVRLIDRLDSSASDAAPPPAADIVVDTSSPAI